MKKLLRPTLFTLAIVVAGLFAAASFSLRAANAAWHAVVDADGRVLQWGPDSEWPPTTNGQLIVSLTDSQADALRNLWPACLWSNSPADGGPTLWAHTGTTNALQVLDRSATTNVVGSYTVADVYGWEWQMRDLLSKYSCNPDDDFGVNYTKLQSIASSQTDLTVRVGMVQDGLILSAIYFKLSSLGSDFTGRRFITNTVPSPVWTPVP